MKRPVVLHAKARQDLDDALAYYDREAPHVVPGFVDALEQAVRAIRRNPRAASPRWGHELDWPGLRSLALEGFPWSVFFVEQPRRNDHA